VINDPVLWASVSLSCGFSAAHDFAVQTIGCTFFIVVNRLRSLSAGGSWGFKELMTGCTIFFIWIWCSICQITLPLVVVNYRVFSEVNLIVTLAAVSRVDKRACIQRSLLFRNNTPYTVDTSVAGLFCISTNNCKNFTIVYNNYCLPVCKAWILTVDTIVFVHFRLHHMWSVYNESVATNDPVAWFESLPVTWLFPAKMAVWIKVLFGVLTRGDPRNILSYVSLNGTMVRSAGGCAFHFGRLFYASIEATVEFCCCRQIPGDI